jgi:hypothetical protein
MPHVRKLLRDAVIAAVNSGVPALAGRVEKVRGYARNGVALPICEVSTPNEQAAGATMDGLVERQVELTAVVQVAGSDGVEDQCDALAVGIEKAILGAGAVQALVKEITLEATSFEMVGEAEQRVARMEMSWGAVIHTFEADPETAI